MKKTILCPICKHAVPRTEPYFPFCSKRCQTIDLASWADGSYSIASEPCSTSDLSNEGDG